MYKVKIVILICIIIIASGCIKSNTNREEIKEMFNNNKTEYIKASKTGDFSTLEELEGIESVYESDNYVIIDFRGFGLVSNSNYYGIYYSESNSLCCIDISPSCNELKKHTEKIIL